MLAQERLCVGRTGRRACESCGRKPPKLLSCSRCCKRYYCSLECQRFDWRKSHRLVCEAAAVRARIDAVVRVEDEEAFQGEGDGGDNKRKFEEEEEEEEEGRKTTTSGSQASASSFETSEAKEPALKKRKTSRSRPVCPRFLAESCLQVTGQRPDAARKLANGLMTGNLKYAKAPDADIVRACAQAFGTHVKPRQLAVLKAQIPKAVRFSTTLEKLRKDVETLLKQLLPFLPGLQVIVSKAENRPHGSIKDLVTFLYKRHLAAFREARFDDDLPRFLSLVDELLTPPIQYDLQGCPYSKAQLQERHDHLRHLSHTAWLHFATAIDIERRASEEEAQPEETNKDDSHHMVAEARAKELKRLRTEFITSCSSAGPTNESNNTAEEAYLLKPGRWLPKDETFLNLI